MAEDGLRIAIGVWVLAVGAAVGSFLNVVVARVPAGESIVSPGSRCPRCGTPIRWWDNLPVASWLVLRGRCRRCGAPISPRYLLVELLGAGVAFVAWRRHGLAPAAAAELAFVAILVALAFIDLATWLLPHALTWPLLGAGLVASALGISSAPSLASSALGAAVGFGAFAAIAWIGERVARREAMGFGDVWLLAGIGAWEGARALLPVVLLASIQGSVVGLLLMAIGRAQPGPGGRRKAGAGETATSSPTPTSTSTSTSTPSSTSTSTSTSGAAPPEHEPPDDEDWVPPRNAVPFGPFLALAAVEWLWLSDRLAALVPALDVFR